MKKIFTLISILALTQTKAQSVLLCDFESTKSVYFADMTGTIDTLAVNPDMSGDNTSAVCARYVKNNMQYDNLKVYPMTTFANVGNFAQASTTSKISMKVRSKMPVGTKIDIQLGSRTDQTYPGGVHSVYTGTTTVINQWETLTFNLTEVPVGGFPYAGSIDKMVIFFNATASAQDTVYFDDLNGPMNEPVTIGENTRKQMKISQNKPNPAQDRTVVTIDLVSSANISMTVYDMLGKAVLTPVNQQLNAGSHDVVVNCQNLTNGVYFYTIKNGEFSYTSRMIVSK